jgi:hypothetical protein
MRDVALDLFRKFDRQGKRVRLLGIGMSRLDSENTEDRDGVVAVLEKTGEQLDLFSVNTNQLQRSDQQRHSEKIGELIDTLRNKYGEGTAMRGSLIERPTEPRRLGREQLAPRSSKHDS